MPTQNMPTKISRERGFTLIEVIITTVMVAIIMAVGLPSFQSFIESNRLTTTANSYLVALNLARSEAIKRGNSVTVCASANQATCTGNTDWSTGWIVFEDDTPTVADPGGSAPTAPPATPTNPLIRVWPPLDNSLTMTGSNANGNDISFIRYTPEGLADINYAIELTLTPEECNGSEEHVINITITGTSSIDQQACTT